MIPDDLKHGILADATTRIDGVGTEVNRSREAAAVSESMSLAQAAEFLHVHPDTCARLTKTGIIPGCKIGRAWVYHRALLDEYLKEQCRSTAEKQKVRGGYESRSLATKLGNLRARRIARQRKSSSNTNGSALGEN